MLFKISIPLFFFLLLTSCAGKECEPCIQDVKVIERKDTDKGFDVQMAEELGADDYGMRQYIMAFLKSGPNREWSEQEADSLQAAHMANIGKMAEDGKLVMAGPFLDEGNLRGIYIFDVQSIEEARELTNSDPAVQAGSLVMELHPWYGSAGLKAVNEIHNKIAKINI